MQSATMMSSPRLGCTVHGVRASTSGSSTSRPVCVPARSLVRVRAADPDQEMEEKLAKIRAARGKTGQGKGTKAAERLKSSTAGSTPAANPSPSTSSKPTYDFSGENLHWEGAPAGGDLALNLALGTTLVWLPLTAAAIGRCVFVKYKFTDRRFSVMTNAPWKTEQTDVAYQEVKGVVTVGRALGLWGDLIITLRNNDKVELRSLEKYKDLRDYILARRDALAPTESETPSGGRAMGGMVTAAELMGEAEPASAGGKSGKKGFA